MRYVKMRILVMTALLAAAVMCSCGSQVRNAETATESERVQTSETVSTSREESTETESADETSETAEESSSEEPVTEETQSSAEEIVTEETQTETAVSAGPEVPEGAVKEMIRMGLSYAAAGYGYSLSDRTGDGGNFDCSGLVARLLKDAFGCEKFLSGGYAWTTADWRNYAASLTVGETVMFGSQAYTVTMKDTEDYLSAWSVPGSIVVQYSPTNRPDLTMGHISVALGEIPYETTADVINYISSEYGIDLSGTTVTGYPMVLDLYGAGAGHTVWKINAQSVAGCVIIDNNFASDPSWTEPAAVVFEPVY